jgi:death on curing protein
MELQFLDTDVRRIYDVLVGDFAQSSDPIEPAGVREDHLLESAVSRQYVSSGEILKDKTPEQNAATLAYGLWNNHLFFNGNITATGK